MTPVKETKEFLDALSALAVRTFNSLSDDGRISVFEGAGYLADLKTVATAISGAPQIPGELLKLMRRPTPTSAPRSKSGWRKWASRTASRTLRRRF
ncbi:hypothetical protein [Verrucomicrobium spinosum]|uniref:hypothetical protein n=1 Tax=Verrucomicrobium spinosum TaxID=2736 RepID=UPI000B2ECE0D|nr:hypothetical protein [Verrucomicrobium spinosum]